MQILQNISQKSLSQSLCAWINCKTFPIPLIFLLHLLRILVYNRNDFLKILCSLPSTHAQGFFILELTNFVNKKGLYLNTEKHLQKGAKQHGKIILSRHTYGRFHCHSYGMYSGRYPRTISSSIRQDCLFPGGRRTAC